MASLTLPLPLPLFSFAGLFSEDNPFSSMQPPTEDIIDSDKLYEESDESDEESAFEAENDRSSQNGESDFEDSKEDIQTPRPHRVVKRRTPEPKKQTPPVQELGTLPNPKFNHKMKGTGRRAKATAAKAVAATFAAKVKATEAAAQVAGDWVTSAILARKTPHKGGAAGASPWKTTAAKLLKEGQIQKARD